MEFHLKVEKKITKCYLIGLKSASKLFPYSIISFSCVPPSFCSVEKRRNKTNWMKKKKTIGQKHAEIPFRRNRTNEKEAARTRPSVKYCFWSEVFTYLDDKMTNYCHSCLRLHIRKSVAGFRKLMNWMCTCPCQLVMFDERKSSH